MLFRSPGENPGDGAALRRITHEHLVDDLFGLIEHLRIGRAFLVGLSFGSTIALKALHRELRRFPRSAVQGGFAHRVSSTAERSIQDRCAPAEEIDDLSSEHRRVICAIPGEPVDAGGRGGHSNRHFPVVPTPSSFAAY